MHARWETSLRVLAVRLFFSHKLFFSFFSDRKTHKGGLFWWYFASLLQQLRALRSRRVFSSQITDTKVSGPEVSPWAREGGGGAWG